MPASSVPESTRPVSLFKSHPRVVWIMAIACGAGVANLWYSQPLLVEMATSFGVSAGHIGLVVTCAQVGYALGIVLFVPLTDLIDRRKLIVALTVAVGGALVGAAVAGSMHWLLLANLAIGITTVFPQAIIPYAASLAQDDERGGVIGSLYTGLLLGILLARTVSGSLGHYFGWRAIYWAASGLMVLLALLLHYLLPKDRPREHQPYTKLMGSIWGLVRNEPEIRRAALIGGGLLGGFSAFWTTLAFLLASPPYHYGSQIAGLFGLIGATGATVAPWTGRLADRHGAIAVRGAALTIMIIAYAILGLGSTHLWALILGVVVLDAGMQSAHVCNQTRIFGLFPKAHGRVNTIYMGGFFGGGSVGSLLGVWAWSHWHWVGVCCVGAVLTVLAICIHLTGRRSAKADRPSVGTSPRSASGGAARDRRTLAR